MSFYITRGGWCTCAACNDTSDFDEAFEFRCEDCEEVQDVGEMADPDITGLGAVCVWCAENAGRL